MEDWKKKDWLVFETSERPIHAYDGFSEKFGLPPKHVRAKDEEAAAKIVMGVTGRISKYAIIEATIIDLAANNNSLVDEIINTPHR
jgi:hypothetical protein